MKPESMPVTVQILDKDYRISCSAEEQSGLMDCARKLDRRMREIRQNGRVIGADRIAVMAALNLLYEASHQNSGGDLDVKRLNALQERVTATVAGDYGNGKAGAPTTGVDASDKSV
jgi:cell division protein ZapA